MLCGSLSFTLMAELAHDLTKECDWQTVAVFRAALVAAFAAGMVCLSGAKLVIWPWRLWVRSIAGSCSMLCTFYAFGKLPAADVVTLTNTFPIWVAIFSWPLYGHSPGFKMLVVILIGVVGVVLVEQPHLESGNFGVAIALAAAAFTAVAMLGLHSLGHLDPRAIVVHFSSVATLFCLGAFLVGPREHGIAQVLETTILVKILAMGLSALIGQLFLTLAFSSGAPAKVSVIGLTQIVFALAFDTFYFNRSVNVLTIVGTALVIAPTAWLLVQSRSASQHAKQDVADPPQEIEVSTSDKLDVDQQKPPASGLSSAHARSKQRLLR
jgi:drug/metabolite transporter (DMT)-like permease